jgi:Arylsulfotransferase (ASST)
VASRLAPTATLSCIVGALCLPIGGTSRADPPVYVFPSPGSQFVSLRSQIVFRGINPTAIGTVSVTGSSSGSHPGLMLPDSDNQGASFLPYRQFAPGEVVTVKTALNIFGGNGGAFQFRVEVPGGKLPSIPFPRAPRTSGDIFRFRSRPDLAPARIKVIRRSARTAPGDIFLAPEVGPLQDGPEILDSSGGLVWFDRLPRHQVAMDFRVQRYQGKPVLTWWQGYVGAGVGTGADLIMDNSYHLIAAVQAGGGLAADIHEFQLTPDGNALITTYNPVIADASHEHGSTKQVTYDATVQEIDVRSCERYGVCLVLFEWDGLDRVPLSDTYASQRGGALAPFDPDHLNAADTAPDGNFVISDRNTWAVYKVNRLTGNPMWILGGKHSTFSFGPGAEFAFQHDVRVDGSNRITMFDDGAGYFNVHKQSRGLTLGLDFTHMRATVVNEQYHVPPILTQREGSDEALPDGHYFVGWGDPFFSEFNGRGQMIFDARFVDHNVSYRVLREPWSATPTAWASWNGATTVVYWRFLAGSSVKSLRGVRDVRRQGFETSISFAARRYVVVQALDASHHVLGQSKTLRLR